MYYVCYKHQVGVDPNIEDRQLWSRMVVGRFTEDEQVK